MDFDTWLGTIMLIPWKWAPMDTAPCDGQTLSITQHDALFALLGVTYGGDGMQNFRLPNLCGRAPMGYGIGPGLSARGLGQMAGAEQTTVTLTANNLPPHAHTLTAGNTASDALAQLPSPGWTLGAAAAVSSSSSAPVQMYAGPTPAGAVQSAAGTVTGPGQAIPLAPMPPVLCLNFLIALAGLFPTRD